MEAFCAIATVETQRGKPGSPPGNTPNQPTSFTHARASYTGSILQLLGKLIKRLTWKVQTLNSYTG